MRISMIIRQIEVGTMDNFCYVVGCEQTRKALVVDPGADVDRIVAEAENAGLSIEAVVNTHGHADHTSGSAALKALTGARVFIHVLDASAGVPADVLVTGDQELRVGNITFNLIHTPGHTPGGMCIYAEGHLFTGDTLFVGDSGRTDLVGGHRPTLGASIRRLMTLPDDTVVWPGHDYGPTSSSTIGWEKCHNVNAKEYGYYKPC
jgi:glyoxylase-like metal-dependent hydrolase (beta-lactamase superfamily II)